MMENKLPTAEIDQITQSPEGRDKLTICAFLKCYSNEAPSALEVNLWCDALSTAPGNIRDALVDWMKVRQTKPTPAEIIKMMNPAAKPEAMRSIAEKIAKRHNIKLDDLLGKRRHRRLAWPRFEAWAEMQDAGFSTPQIGRYFNRDHTSILHGIKRHKRIVGKSHQTTRNN